MGTSVGFGVSDVLPNERQNLHHLKCKIAANIVEGKQATNQQIGVGLLVHHRVSMHSHVLRNEQHIHAYTTQDESMGWKTS